MRKTILLPSGKYVNSGRAITKEGNFVWGEATAKLSRTPRLLSIEHNIIRAAEQMERVRKHLVNRPIIITSWYRPPYENKLAGGSPNSRHIYGDGVDFWIKDTDLKYAFRALDDWHQKGGLALYRTHIHIDFRGHRARW